jgi:hypothetical protein
VYFLQVGACKGFLFFGEGPPINILKYIHFLNILNILGKAIKSSQLKVLDFGEPMLFRLILFTSQQ